MKLNPSFKMMSVFLTFSAVVLVSCGEMKNETPEKEPLSVPEKVAAAHGIANWKSVNELEFTFNVDRDTAHFERHWKWLPKSGEVISVSGGDTVKYNKIAVDSSLVSVDAAFINDKYWLLAPFNLVWDRDNFSYTSDENIPAPLSKEPMHKLTIVYKDDGGYTPGDAYDFYFGDDYLIKEWVFRKSNQPEASLTTTWEGYREIMGIKLATAYNRPDPSTKLYISDISIK